MIISIPITKALWTPCSCGRERIVERWEKIMDNVGL